MVCKKCNGKVCIDRVFSERMHVELFCIRCGKRWMLDKTKNRLAAWLQEREKAFETAFMNYPSKGTNAASISI